MITLGDIGGFLREDTELLKRLDTEIKNAGSFELESEDGRMVLALIGQFLFTMGNFDEESFKLSVMFFVLGANIGMEVHERRLQREEIA